MFRRGVNDFAFKMEHKEAILVFYKRIKQEAQELEDEIVAKAELYGKKKLFRPGSKIFELE